MKKIQTILAGLLVFTLAVFSGCNADKNVLTMAEKEKIQTDKLPRVHREIEMLFNPSDLKKAFGSSENVFVAQVLEENETVYFQGNEPFTYQCRQLKSNG
jgi:hypothetical protein